MNILQGIYTLLGILFYIGLVSFVVGYCLAWGWYSRRSRFQFKTETNIHIIDDKVKPTVN